MKEVLFLANMFADSCCDVYSRANLFCQQEIARCLRGACYCKGTMFLFAFQFSANEVHVAKREKELALERVTSADSLALGKNLFGTRSPFWFMGNSPPARLLEIRPNYIDVSNVKEKPVRYVRSTPHQNPERVLSTFLSPPIQSSRWRTYFHLKQVASIYFFAITLCFSCT